MESYSKNYNEQQFMDQAIKEEIPLYIITSQKDQVKKYFTDKCKTEKLPFEILSADGTAIKTAARANPTLFVMKGSVIQNKLSWADMEKR